VPGSECSSSMERRHVWRTRSRASSAACSSLLLGEGCVGVGPPLGLGLRLGFLWFGLLSVCLLGLCLGRLGSIGLREDLLELDGGLGSRGRLLLGALCRLHRLELLVGRELAALGEDVRL